MKNKELKKKYIKEFEDKFLRFVNPNHRAYILFFDVEKFLSQTIDDILKEKESEIIDKIDNWLAYQRNTDIKGNWLVDENDWIKFKAQLQNLKT